MASPTIPIIISQTILLVSSTDDIGSIAGLMQAHQAALSNQLSVAMWVVGGVGTIAMIVIGAVGWFWQNGVKERSVDLAVNEAKKILYSKEYLENLGNAFRKTDEPDSSIPKG